MRKIIEAKLNKISLKIKRNNEKTTRNRKGKNQIKDQ